MVERVIPECDEARFVADRVQKTILSRQAMSIAHFPEFLSHRMTKMIDDDDSPGQDGR